MALGRLLYEEKGRQTILLGNEDFFNKTLWYNIW
jgi:hypothetical protein